ncbi:Spy/CpxP family protein refolding chaperone [Lutibacter sp.]|uniref:Spy/CpxP family protein refolding chaperone n=1 Tax=Lutibacter sp. TaxID=1925666 RepID=UPI003567BFDB
MKKIIGFTVLVLMLSFTMNAQNKKGGNRQGSDYTPEQMATLQTKKMTLRLDLTEGQQKEIYKLMLTSAKEREIQREEFQKNRKDGVKLTADEKFDREKLRLEKQLTQKAAMKKILNADQYEKWEKNMGQMGMNKRSDKMNNNNYNCSQRNN